MKTLVLAVSLLCSALPVAAQSKVYTNADLAPTKVSWTRTPSVEELRGLEARQFVYVPARTAPRVIVTSGSQVGDGPFGAFAPPIPDRRLDGSLWTDPPWEMRAYVGHGFYGRSYGHGGYGRQAPSAEPPVTRPVTRR